MEKAHLFVIQGDLTTLAVDYVLLPCDADANFHIGFKALLGNDVEAGTFEPESHVRPAGSSLWCEELAYGVRQLEDLNPRVWLLDTSVETRRSAEGLIESVVTALQTICATGAHRADADTGLLPSVGLPLVGIQKGGFADNYSDVLDRLVGRLDDFLHVLELDIVLTLWERSDYAAVQYLRRKALPEDTASSDAKALAEKLWNSNVVLFIGAGVSVGAGGGTWWDLIDRLAAAARPEFQPEEIEALKQLDPRDAVTVIANRNPSAGADLLRHQVVEAINVPQYSLAHGLLASLDLPEAITTNYDRQYEMACVARIAGHLKARPRGPQDLTVLPRQRATPGWPWLLKIHGDVEVPRSIVISRDDYIQFDHDSSPAASVVQSRMLTGHMLFVGYSVTDEDVVRLAREVQRYRREFLKTDVLEPVGTVISLGTPSVKRELWEGLLTFVDLGGEPEPEARAVLLFLDLVAMRACHETSFLLDDKYRGLVRKLTGAARQLAAWPAEDPYEPPADDVVDASLNQFISAAAALAELADRSSGEIIQDAALQVTALLDRLGYRPGHR